MQKPQKRDVLRDSLLAAAEAMIEQKGSQGLRARDLTQAAGCALGALYNVFPDMDALVIAVKLRILDQLDGLMQAVPAGADGQAQLLGLADAYLDFALRFPRRWQALFKHQLGEGVQLPVSYFQRLAEIFGHIDAPLAQILPDMMPEARATISRALFAGVHGIVLLGLEQRLGHVSPDQIRAQYCLLVNNALAGLRAHPAPQV